MTFVSKGDAPILTFQGTKDPLVPHTQATKLADAMTAAGVPGRVELLIGAGHGWGGDDLKRTMDETFAFFDKYLKPKGTSRAEDRAVTGLRSMPGMLAGGVGDVLRDRRAERECGSR